MIRTRDFLIFVGILLFLCLGIVFTLFSDKDLGSIHDADLTLSLDDSPVFYASAPSASTDREGAIARLRALLQEDKGLIITNPSVEETGSVESSEQESVTADAHTAPMAIDRCEGFSDPLLLTRNWPLTETTLAVQDGRRVVLHTPKEATSPIDVNASSSASVYATTPTVLLSLSLTPSVASESTCVLGDVVGVTPYGALIFNTDVSMYRHHTSEMLIGYARDGFSIYGLYQGELDRCGGYQHPSGYRYSISPERNFIIGCYQSSPASFTGL